jgi:hypothetical protein
LRLARRGDVVYFLIAEGDSPNFRIVRTEQVAAADVKLDALRLIAQIKEAGRIDLVWKSLTVRAEGLSGLALEDPAEVVAELDRQREALPARFGYDFSRETWSDSRWYRWAVTPPKTVTPQGLIMRGQPVDHWASAGTAPHIELRGDFDISFEFDVLRVDVPKPGMYSAVYLQIEFPIPSKLQGSVILGRRENGNRYASAQVRLMNPDGTHSYPTLRQELVENVRRMRLARRGQRLFFLYSDGSQPDRLLARYDASDAEIPDTFIRMMAHTGGTGKVMEAAWKKFTVHAGQISGAAQTLTSSK